MFHLVFTDSETRSPADLPKEGGYRYTEHPDTEALIWTWAVDNEPVGGIWSPEWAWSRKPDKHPERLLSLAEDPDVYFVAWNANFDRRIWNDVMVKKYGWPEVPLHRWLCAQAQAEASNLPGKLEKAAEALRLPQGKDSAGKNLIELLSHGTRRDWIPTKHEAHMGRFRAYGLRDTYVMRTVWQHTRPLTMAEWEDYHASERINDRGVLVDLDFARAAENYSRAETDDLNVELYRLSQNPRLTVTNHTVKAKWIHEQLWPSPELQTLVERPEKEKGKARYSADKETRNLLMDALSNPDYADLFEPDHLSMLIDVLEVIESGNSAAVRKFSAISRQACRDRRLRGQYTFNGAGQTGRYSSRGAQLHNTVRDPVEKGNPDRALDAIEDILSGVDSDVLVDTYGYPVSRLLARLVRPTFIAPEGRTLVWGDWDQVEARVLPWLADRRGGDEVLRIFASGRDIYKYNAAPIYGLGDPEACTPEQRQIGKVATLSLGFGGGVGAFTAMGRGYGVYVPAGQAQEIVTAWRDGNPWCVAFWYELWEAAIRAYKTPGTFFNAGRVAYAFAPNLMGGTLICRLPDGRWLVYPEFRYEYREVENRITKEKYKKWVASCRKAYSGKAIRVSLWHGILAENATQATAASLLRDAMVNAQDELDIVLHTHDEIVAECAERNTDATREALAWYLTHPRDCYDGLPLSCSIEHGPYYTK